MQLKFERNYLSQAMPGLQFRVKRISLAERMRFLADNHGLMQKLKFLSAGKDNDPRERISMAEHELELSRRLLDACLVGIFEYNGEKLTQHDTVAWLLQKAPTEFCVE